MKNMTERNRQTKRFNQKPKKGSRKNHSKGIRYSHTDRKNNKIIINIYVG